MKGQGQINTPDVRDSTETRVDTIHMLTETERRPGLKGYHLVQFMEMNPDFRENRQGELIDKILPNLNSEAQVDECKTG